MTAEVTRVSGPDTRVTDLEQRFSRIDRTLEELERKAEALQAAYTRAGASVRRGAEDDLTRISAARTDGERIAKLLRGTELSAKYAQDADRNLAVSNTWRRIAVVSAALAAGGLAALASMTDLRAQELAVMLVPLLALFGYAAVESSNHRRREFDRRRIALRVSAIEAFTRPRIEGKDASARKGAEQLLGDFIHKHFIEPDLDSNDMSYPVVSMSVVSFRERGDKSTGNRAEDLT